jgi:hypothetical protein
VSPAERAGPSEREEPGATPGAGPNHKSGIAKPTNQVQPIAAGRQCRRNTVGRHAEGVISPDHLAMLDASGITPEHAALRGYESITDKRRLAELKIVTAARSHVPGLVVPLLRPDGCNWGSQYRPDEPRIRDGRPIKYETPWRQRNGLDIPPGVGPMLGDPEIPLWITEGVKKADCGALHGLCVVALSGVWNWD